MTRFQTMLSYVFAPHIDIVQKLKNSPRELFCIFLIAFLTAFGMAGSGSIMVIYFTDEFHYTDVEASRLFAFSTIGYIVFGLLIGTVIDRIGIKNSLVLGGVLGMVCTIMIALAWSREMLIFSVVVMLPISTLFVLPVIVIARKRYTYVENKRVAFMLAYLIYNAGVACSYFYVDFIRHRFSEGVRFRSYSATAARVIFLSGAISTLLGSIVAACGLRNIMVDDKGTIKPFSMNSEITNEQSSQNEKIRKSWYKTFCEPDFVRYVVYCLTMFPLLKMFTYFDITFPKSAVRQLGPDVAFASVKAWNPILIFMFQPYFSHWFRNLHKYKVITIGSAIAAFSVFIFCIPPSYESFSAAFIFFTLGEMIFSHRVDDLATDFMPKGREGTYSTLMGIYLIIPGYIINAMSGWLLSTYCPIDGERHCQMMWFIIGLMACVTPVLLVPLEKYLLGGERKMLQEVELEKTPGSYPIEEPKPIKLDETHDNDYLKVKVAN